MTDRFFIRFGGRFICIRMQDIVYLEACKNYCKLFTEKDVYMVQATLISFMKILPQDDFCQIHRAYIVSLARIRSFTTEELQLEKRQLPVGDKFRRDLFRRVMILSNDYSAMSKLSKGSDE